ncbi:MAG: hypothetical protein CMB99_13645 [Flavobacteriaceae bacterium]|nr:hypothetical protein [Flavobacteriaceae bacterium]|tara:strand:- start:14769 stop:15212 length:444 start_codon:yes stop_codon:yes gene_type:complete
METIIKRPHFFFFALIPFFISIGILNYDSIIDFSVSNEFFAIKVNHWCIFSAIFVGLIGLNYATLKWIRRRPRRDLTLLHIVLQTGAILLFLVFLLGINPQLSSFQQLIPFEIDYHQILSNSFLLFSISVVIHMINFVQCLIVKTAE